MQFLEKSENTKLVPKGAKQSFVIQSLKIRYQR